VLIDTFCSPLDFLLSSPLGFVVSSSRRAYSCISSALKRVWSQLLSGHHARFVHVLRDGRDVALGDLRLVTSLACAAYFTAQHLEEDISLAGHFREKSGNNNDNSSSSSSSILSYEGFTKDKTSGQESRGKGRGSSFTERFDTSQGHLLRQAQSCSLGRACSAAGRAPQLVVWALLNEVRNCFSYLEEK